MSSKTAPQKQGMSMSMDMGMTPEFHGRGEMQQILVVHQSREHFCERTRQISNMLPEIMSGEAGYSTDCLILEMQIEKLEVTRVKNHTKKRRKNI